MTQSVLEVYKEVSEIKNAIKLAQFYSESAQNALLESLLERMNLDLSDQDGQYLVKTALHFLEFGASQAVTDNAWACLTMMKSFTIRQNKENLQLFCFRSLYSLLYMRFFSGSYQQACVSEITEFSRSDNQVMRLFFMAFYFDDKANSGFHLLKQDLEVLPIEILQALCAGVESLVQDNISLLPQLVPDSPAVVVDAVLQRFLNQFVYGDFGLRHSAFVWERQQCLLQCLCRCSALGMFQKALIKQLEYLLHQLELAESANDLEAILPIKRSLDLICDQVNLDDFGAQKKQWDKALAACMDHVLLQG